MTGDTILNFKTKFYNNEVRGLKGMGSIQKQLATYSNLLECLLQFWVVRGIPRSDHSGPALSNAIKPAGDYLGFLFPAVISFSWQLHRWPLQ